MSSIREFAPVVLARVKQRIRQVAQADVYTSSSCVGLIAACVLAFDVRHDAGLTLDELPQMRYGRRIAAWFLSGFHDRRALDPDNTLTYYGGLFDALAQLAVHFTPACAGVGFCRAGRSARS